MLSLVIKFIASIILTETITEIITKSELFVPIKKKIFSAGQKNKFFKWLHELLDCGYCFSVWASVFVVVVLLRKVGIINPYIDWFIIALVVHRLSNLFHNIMDRINR